jgi:hypothetical protein
LQWKVILDELFFFTYRDFLRGRSSDNVITLSCDRTRATTE